MFTRRSVLQAAAMAPLAAPAIAQSNTTISFLTWNIIDQEKLFRSWFKAFEDAHPGVHIEWLDKKGPELPAFFQTQLAAGTPPDVVDLQGALWLEYAAGEVLLPLDKYLGSVQGRFNADYLGGWRYQKKTYMVPFYIAKTLMFMNKSVAGKAEIDGLPTSVDGLIAAADKLAGPETSGFLTLNFDWLYWPIFAASGIDLLTPDLKEPAFNTPHAAALVDRLAKSSAKGGINKISWNGRWVEPNGAFAAGNVGMFHAHSSAYFFFKGQGNWVSPATLEVGEFPGNWSTPTNHGYGITAGSKNQDLSWEFIKFITDQKQATALARNRMLLTGNVAVDQALLASVKTEDPLVYQVLATQVAHTDKLTGNWKLPQDARVKDAFWPELQSALLGRKGAKEALATAEHRVARELRRA